MEELARMQGTTEACSAMELQWVAGAVVLGRAWAWRSSTWHGRATTSRGQQGGGGDTRASGGVCAGWHGGCGGVRASGSGDLGVAVAAAWNSDGDLRLLEHKMATAMGAVGLGQRHTEIK